MSHPPVPPSNLPDRDQIEHLISLLTEVLEKKSDTDLAETIHAFATSNELIHRELQRIASDLQEAVKVIPAQEGIDQRLGRMSGEMASMNRNLERLLSEMMAPPED